jgi:hypothetical protein
MTLTKRLAELVRACFTGIWIESHEHQDALAEIARLCHAENWRLVTWDIEQGVTSAGSTGEPAIGQDPLAAIRSLSTLASENGAALLVLQNFHRFLQSAEIVQALARQIMTGKLHRTFIVILSPVVNVPVELEKLLVVLEHDLPSREQLHEIASGIATESGELPEGQELQTLLDAASGLTRYEAEGAFSLALVRHNRLTADVLWQQKSQLLKKSNTLSLHHGHDNFSSLGGLAALKTFCKRSLLGPSRNDPRRRPRGVMLLGLAGTGKSAFCKALGAEVGRPTLALDVGAMYGSLVGDTERNIRQALRTIDAMQPAILLIDEIEKALAGVSGSGDSGVSARLFGTFLTWLSDHDSDVYVVASCNDISKLPPEFSRAERWDGVFFVDLPGRVEKDAIWQLYLDFYQLDRQQRLPNDAKFTGAEIKSCCRLAALLDLPLVQAAQNVVPVATTASESVERLRTWASGRCLSADQPGIYCQTAPSNGTRRRVSRDASTN